MNIFVLLGIAILATVVPETKHPNVIVFLADDLGWADLACYGSEFHETPNLDNLAKQGIRFTTAYSAASLCSPTRASIMTGKHPVRVNITDWIPGAGDKGRLLKTPQDVHNLSLDELTMGEAFKESGYTTFYAGKWHLGDPNHGPDKQGFDTYIETATRTVDEMGKSKRTRIALPIGNRWHLTRHITSETSKFLSSQSREQPFFAFVSYHDVHTPILPDDEFVKGFKVKSKSFPNQPPVHEGDGKTRMSQNNAAYASMVRALDKSVGDILASLKNTGLEQNTIVLFASDNGGLSTLKNPGPACNVPLRAGKGWLYEGGIRIPLIVKYPGVIPEGVKSDMPVVTTDFYPTLLSFSGLQLRPRQHIDGTDFSHVCKTTRTKSIPDRDLFWHFPHYHGSRWTPGSAIRAGKWKLIKFYETGKTELYDLDSDPSEQNDLANVEKDVLKTVSGKLLAWQIQVGAKVPVPRN